MLINAEKNNVRKTHLFVARRKRGMEIRTNQIYRQPCSLLSNSIHPSIRGASGKNKL